jgi:hypothetical protein
MLRFAVLTTVKWSKFVSRIVPPQVATDVSEAVLSFSLFPKYKGWHAGGRLGGRNKVENGNRMRLPKGVGVT